ncbi:MAG: response regulator [Asticcacaulis sp.]|uniref:response regulator n=1 Tax=Asticcacaulis sp. TaxID=1872648 RepID=UPI0039E30C2F
MAANLAHNFTEGWIVSHVTLPDSNLPNSPAENTRLRVLVVDDNEPSALAVSWIVESLGDETRTCLNGPCALLAAIDFRPDVILLDIAMPGMDGLQVSDRLRADPRFSQVKIIAQTGWGDATMRQQTALHGFDLHLVKPVETQLLANMFNRLRKGRPPA